MKQDRECVICSKQLGGSQRIFCSNRCKQAEKYARKCGRICAACHKPIKKPVPVVGGFSQQCDRKRCIGNQEK